MTPLEGESARVIDGKNFSIEKFKMEMGLTSVDLWCIVDKFKETPPSNSESK